MPQKTKREKKRNASEKNGGQQRKTQKNKICNKSLTRFQRKKKYTYIYNLFLYIYICTDIYIYIYVYTYLNRKGSTRRSKSPCGTVEAPHFGLT